MNASDFVPPIIPDGKVVDFTDDHLRQIYGRIELIDQHFERCCAFQQDGCHYGDEYNRLYKVLDLAGVPNHKTPFDRDEFEAWLASRATIEEKQ